MRRSAGERLMPQPALGIRLLHAAGRVQRRIGMKALQPVLVVGADLRGDRGRHPVFLGHLVHPRDGSQRRLFAREPLFPLEGVVLDERPRSRASGATVSPCTTSVPRITTKVMRMISERNGIGVPSEQSQRQRQRGGE